MAVQDSAMIKAAIQAQRAAMAALFDQLRLDGLDEPGVSRDPYGAGEQRAHATVTKAAEALGLEIGHDAAVNLYMTLPGRDRTAPVLVIGSHLDSVPHGGNFDGAAGVLAGLAIVAALRSLGVTPQCDIVVMGIRAEESVWFQVSYIGSRGSLGTLPDGALDVRRVDTGRTLADHIADCGGNPDALRARRRHFDPARIRAYLELHIEQAPSLVEAGLPVAICTGIPGNFRYPDARIEGRHDHVGLPRRFRRDAAIAGAEFAMALDTLWADYDERNIPMACTLGRFHTDPAAHGLTIVPGSFQFSLDVRAYDEAVLADLEDKTSRIIDGIEQRRGVRFHLGQRAGAAVGLVDPALQAGLEAAAETQGIRFLRIGSPASHDAAAFGAAGVPMGMIFVRNENGSHNPFEAMAVDDFLAGVTVLLQ
ncbi:MAG: beta-ureidopropionase / N-carbamoyl-L-amino-acid hydrolase, partial [Acetobacteraceae bacterium]|nr:beta-ureidopropionase / N-carbamoyl-L-amino-acid hydrolase [Acetobacteraceae bacterium]